MKKRPLNKTESKDLMPKIRTLMEEIKEQVLLEEKKRGKKKSFTIHPSHNSENKNNGFN